MNVEALMSQLLRRKITRGRFSLPYTDEQVRDMLTAAVMAEVAYRHQSYRVSSEMDSYIEQAAQWLKGQDKFGLLMCGVPGNGKTTLMRAIQSLFGILDLKDDYNNHLGLVIVDAREIARINKDNYELYKIYCNKPMLGIDDLGLEPTEVLDYGNVLNPVIDLLSHRYNEQLFTVITTNLQPKQIREKYKDRIADRFNEMMEKIIFKNGSYRASILPTTTISTTSMQPSLAASSSMRVPSSKTSQER